MQKAWIVVGALLVALLLFGAGWAVKGMRDNAAQAAGKARADSVLQAVTVDAQRALDSLARLHAAKTAKVDSLETNATALRRRADSVYTAAFGKDTLLAKAKTAADSLPVVLDQLFSTRLAYQNLNEAVEDMKASRVLHFEADTVHFAADSVERSQAKAREDALRAVNADLTQRLLAKDEKQKILGFLPKPTCGPGVGMTVGATVAKTATSGKLAIGAGASTGITVACVLGF